MTGLTLCQGEKGKQGQVHSFMFIQFAHDVPGNIHSLCLTD